MTPGRRGRKPKEDRAHGFQPVVNIRKVERQRADREFQINGNKIYFKSFCYNYHYSVHRILFNQFFRLFVEIF